MKARNAIVLLVVLISATWLIHNSNSRAKPSKQTPLTATDKAAGILPRLPAPRIQAQPAPSVEPAERFCATNLLARVLKGDEAIKLSLQQVEAYLSENRRSAESLIGAFRATGDRSLLQEALEKYPNDPKVCCAACFDILHNRDLPEDVRQQRLDAFKKASPDNALPNYLAAANLFKAGRTDEAVQEMSAAAGKSNYRDYRIDFMQSSEEAYRSAGYSQIEAKAVSSFDLPLPQLSVLKKLGQNLSELSNLYQQGGDTASAEAARQLGLNLARQVGEQSTPNCFIDNLVGIAIESRILEQMDPSSPYGGSSGSVKDRLDELTQRRQSLKAIGAESEGIMSAMSEQDLLNYFDRLKVSGELEAIRWAMNRRKQP